MQVIAHRGASGHLTENTLAAFALARRLGAHGVELDARPSRDGRAVVFHDADLARLAGREARVAALPWSELAQVPLVGGGAIPLLEAVYEAVGPDLQVHVELKVDGWAPTGLEAAVVQAVRRAGGEGRTVFSCFHPVALWRLRRLAPDIPRALLFGADQALPLRRGWHAVVVPVAGVHPEHRLLDAGEVARWHRTGRAVRAWTVNDPARVRALAAIGVDAVITDLPDQALAVLRGKAEPAAPAAGG